LIQFNKNDAANFGNLQESYQVTVAV